MVKNKWFVDSSLLIISMIWGSTFVLVQNAVQAYSPFAFLYIRFLVASLCIGTYVLFFHRKRWNSKIIQNGFILGILLFLGFAFQTFSLVYTTPAKSGFITGLNVALVPVFLYLLYRQTINFSILCGVIFAVAGLYLLAFTDLNSINIGDLLALACAIGFSLHIVYTSRLAKGLDSLQIVTISFLTVTILSLGSTLIWEDASELLDWEKLLNPNIIWAIIICSIFATVIAYFAQTYFMEYTSPTKVGVIFATEPVFAAIADWLWNEASFPLLAWIGCCCILVGMLLTEIDFRSVRSKKETSHFEA